MTVTATIHTPPPDPVPDRRVVTLTMPYDVAVTLRSLLGRCVYGEAGKTYRGHVDHVYGALAEAIPNIPRARFTGCVHSLELPKE